MKETAMNSRRVILFLILMSGNPATLLAGEVMKLTENDAGKTVELRIGDDLEIALPANPTTGYVWEVSSLNSAILKQDKAEFLPGDNAIGSGGMDVIKLHAIGEGKTELNFIYHRPFEKNKPPLKTFAITVIINK